MFYLSLNFIHYHQEIVIDITERAPDDHPSGIEYRLFGEACIPSITSFPIGIPNIFEEHRIVKNLNVFRYHAHELAPGSGVFGEDENKFIFYNVIVGYKVKARFKIANPNKVKKHPIFGLFLFSPFSFLLYFSRTKNQVYFVKHLVVSEKLRVNSQLTLNYLQVTATLFRKDSGTGVFL